MVQQNKARLTVMTPPTMNFTAALEQALDGKGIRRLEWEDSGIYVAFYDELLMIFRTDDGKLHPLTVSTGDVISEDWIVVRQG